MYSIFKRRSIAMQIQKEKIIHTDVLIIGGGTVAVTPP